LSQGELIEVTIGWTEEELTGYLDCWSSICAPEAVLAHAGTWPARREEYGTWFRGWLELGERVTAQQVAAARIAFDRCTGHVNAVFEATDGSAVDVLVCPAMPSPPDSAWGGGPDMRALQPELLHTDTPDVVESAEGPYSPGSHGRFTIPFDYSGHPTLTLPCGLTDGSRGKRVPLAVQLVGDRLSELLLCELGHAFEGATGGGFTGPLIPPLETAWGELAPSKL
jgi:amidase